MEEGKQMNSMEKVNQFRDERNWRQFHNEKDLAISISLEASELLELFIHDGRQPSPGSR